MDSELFPLRDITEATALTAREHARETDRILGFRISDTEAQIRMIKADEDHEIWAHVDEQVLLTPYLELRLILNLLNPVMTNTLVDLGAAYCRLAHVMSRHFPTVRFLGFECVELRVDEAQRVMNLQNCKNSQVVCADIANPHFEVPYAEFYFCYDFGSHTDISRLLQKLKEKSQTLKRPFKLVARGIRIRDAIESQHRSWLFKEGPMGADFGFAIYANN